MSEKKKLTRIWVDPEFKKAIRVEAAERNLNIGQLTRELGKKKKKGERFDFGF